MSLAKSKTWTECRSSGTSRTVSGSSVSGKLAGSKQDPTAAEFLPAYPQQQTGKSDQVAHSSVCLSSSPTEHKYLGGPTQSHSTSSATPTNESQAALQHTRPENERPDPEPCHNHRPHYPQTQQLHHGVVTLQPRASTVTPWTERRIVRQRIHPQRDDRIKLRLKSIIETHKSPVLMQMIGMIITLNRLGIIPVTPFLIIPRVIITKVTRVVAHTVCIIITIIAQDIQTFSVSHILRNRTLQVT